MATSEITVDSDALEGFVERLEEITDAREALKERAGVVYGEIKEAGMSVETVRVMVKERRLEPEVRDYQYKIRDSYRRALHLYAETELGAAAIEAAMKTARTRKPPPFAEQPVARTRGRPRKNGNGNPDPFAAARAHLEGDPQ